MTNFNTFCNSYLLEILTDFQKCIEVVILQRNKNTAMIWKQDLLDFCKMNFERLKAVKESLDKKF